MPFLAEAIDSIRAQEYKNFRHCIVDDGSSDGTADFLSQAANVDLTVIYTQPIGRGRALNLGVARSQSEFIAILDADDTAAPGWLAAMVGIMQSQPEVAVLSCSGMLSKEAMDSDKACKANAYQLSASMFLYRNPVHHSGTLIRKQALLEVGGYDETRDCLFDYELWVRLMKQGKQIWRVDNGYIFKRIHAGQHFERSNRLHYLLSSYRIRRNVCADLLGGKKAMIPALLFLYGLLPRWIRHWVYSRRNLGGSF
ncbi:hypothetical protein MIZ03_4224 [Rhodoferax lithotrophicus]|uniref:Glycosyltransferase 2-like domain-containing protein n=2 Tax=Rhodoferax lithotrophicus TaxID=2798804 RepID=A0ABN6DBB4_9BURK|nr:hypothetical protein MIZ03_4224 [Rhodoferax sp. MIZ03]